LLGLRRRLKRENLSKAEDVKMENISIEIEDGETGEILKFKASCNVSAGPSRSYGHPDDWHDSYYEIENIELSDMDDNIFPKEKEKELWKLYANSIHNQVENAVREGI